MLDSIKMGMLRLNTNSAKPYGYLRITPKDGSLKSYFRIPLKVVFDLVGYNTYKECIQEANPEFKTWIQDIILTIPPEPSKNPNYCLDSGHEWFLGNLRALSLKYSSFPTELGEYVKESIRLYLKTKKQEGESEIPEEYETETETEVKVSKADTIVGERALEIYGQLQRSRFDPGRPGEAGEFYLQPFVRNKSDKPAKDIIEFVTETVADFILENPKVSKYSETEGSGLKVKLTSVFMECFYKEQIQFMQKKLEAACQ